MDNEFGDYIKRKADENRRESVLGVVTNVFPRTSSGDEINHQVNVQAINQQEEFREIPVHVNRYGNANVPNVGDPVEVDFLGSVSQEPYVSSFIHTLQNKAPLAEEGHFRYRFGDSGPYLFIEAEPRDHGGTSTTFDGHDSSNPIDTIRMALKSDGLSDPDARIEIDDSGSGQPTIRMVRGKEEQGAEDMGIELDFETGEFKIGDGSGYGIVSDGNGNFTWYEQSVDFVDDGSTITW